ncbi:two-component system response regulator YesN [Paenibacillus phyllosphaerae]|uniref:Two-component system response regulator YesN n=1 Tax=Paenibacillus phyllosphaerae TaxID=274593 RepID=A0A7W5AT44_9BACL|nr:response regulator [Paenibacillus phyllosphaerae]MBB3108188.1 two-component system response regulator YesN [Paenibacillus phyllosphaerae]
MWKLLIADDEPKIRRGLSKVLPWEELGITVVAEAENGLEALEMCRQHEPDILFVDICMPHLSGLEFIEQLREGSRGGIVIVISGHDEFRYAQQALKLGVFDYLLKPVQKSKLAEVIGGALESLQQSKAQEQRLTFIQHQLNHHSTAIRNTFLTKWIGGFLEAGEIERNIAFFNLGLSGLVHLIVLKAVPNLDIGKKRRVWDKGLLEFSVHNIVADVLGQMSVPSHVVFNDAKGHTIIIGSIGGGDWRAICASIQGQVELLLEKPILIEQSPAVHGKTELSDAYVRMLASMENKGSLTPLVMLTKSFIERNYHQPSLTLADVAEGIQVSPTYLSKQLKKELGLSFIDYLTEVRIQKAIQLLNDPYIKVYEVAEKVGYSSQHYFSSAFKKITGTSPTLYKRSGTL